MAAPRAGSLNIPTPSDTPNNSDIFYKGYPPNSTDIIDCGDDIPSSSDLFYNQDAATYTVITINFICFLTCLWLYFEEIWFIIRNFRGKVRKQKTIYILGLSPIYASCAMLGIMIPRAATLVDLVNNSYFAMVMYSLMGLLDNYLGGRSIIESSGVTSIVLNTTPCCCCCPCLPRPALNKSSYRKLLVMVYQVVAVRPVLMFLTAVLWVDGQYIPGKISPKNSSLYIFLLNLLSTLVAVWGLVIMQKTFRPALLSFKVGFKFLYLQMVLSGTAIGNIIITILVSQNVIPCSAFLPSSSRATRIYHSFVVFWMLLMTLWGRFAFRRKEDGVKDSTTQEVEQCALIVHAPTDDQTTIDSTQKLIETNDNKTKIMDNNMEITTV